MVSKYFCILWNGDYFISTKWNWLNKNHSRYKINELSWAFILRLASNYAEMPHSCGTTGCCYSQRPNLPPLVCWLEMLETQVILAKAYNSFLAFQKHTVRNYLVGKRQQRKKTLKCDFQRQKRIKVHWLYLKKKDRYSMYYN